MLGFASAGMSGVSDRQRIAVCPFYIISLLPNFTLLSHDLTPLNRDVQLSLPGLNTERDTSPSKRHPHTTHPIIGT